MGVRTNFCIILAIAQDTEMQGPKPTEQPCYMALGILNLLDVVNVLPIITIRILHAQKERQAETVLKLLRSCMCSWTRAFCQAEKKKILKSHTGLLFKEGLTSWDVQTITNYFNMVAMTE